MSALPDTGSGAAAATCRLLPVDASRRILCDGLLLDVDRAGGGTSRSDCTVVDLTVLSKAKLSDRRGLLGEPTSISPGWVRCLDRVRRRPDILCLSGSGEVMIVLIGVGVTVAAGVVVAAAAFTICIVSDVPAGWYLLLLLSPVS